MWSLCVDQAGLEPKILSLGITAMSQYIQLHAGATVDHELVMEHWGPSLEWALLRTCDLFPVSAPDILLKNDQSQ